MLTGRQAAYVAHRSNGLRPTAAARAAGYAIGSAKVAGSRLEKLPAIQEAIARARETAHAGNSGTPEVFADAESYLAAVVAGTTPADPTRTQAARALLPFQRAKTRAPVRAQTPRELQHREALESETELLEAWARKAAAVRARLARERTGT